MFNESEFEANAWRAHSKILEVMLECKREGMTVSETLLGLEVVTGKAIAAIAMGLTKPQRSDLIKEALSFISDAAHEMIALYDRATIDDMDGISIN